MSTYSEDVTRPDPVPGSRRRRRRWPVVVVIVVVVLLGLAVAGDRFAAAYAENKIASEIQKQGFGAKPDVSIDGFPFLTQVAARHFQHAHMSARNVREGPLTINRIELSAAGPDKVKMAVDLDIVSGSAIAQVTKVGRDQIRVHVTSVEGFSMSDLGSQDLDFTVPVTDLPLGMRFESVRVTSKGVQLRITGSHIAF
jgi:hypothetical protein